MVLYTFFYLKNQGSNFRSSIVISIKLKNNTFSKKKKIVNAKYYDVTFIVKIA